jgi:hypothetical protein
MFDIVSGRETRAAVLLAASSQGFGLAQMHNDNDGLRFSMESQFYVLPGVSRVLYERASRQIYANALQRPFPLRIWFRRSQTST